LKSFGLSAAERIKSRIDFENLYDFGKVVFSGDKKIKAVYLIEENQTAGKVQIAAAVSSKAGKAVWRNRIKRLIRNSYRLNKEKLFKICLLKKIVLKIIFSPNRLNEKNNPVVVLDEIMPGIKDILFQIERSL
jgi:ribonuclease P protein component